MDIAQLQAESRDATGTRAARRLRRQGKLPGIIYGHGQAPQNVAVPAHDLSNLLQHGAHVVEVSVDGAKHAALIKEVQFDHLSADPVHVDFTLVDLSEKVRVSVPLEFRGTPVGTHEGGVLEHNMVDVEVECRVTEIPASLRVNVADMKLGDMLHVSNLELPQGITAVSPPDAIVSSVRARTAAAEVGEEEAVEEEGAEEPEIIGRKKEEDESGAEE